MIDGIAVIARQHIARHDLGHRPLEALGAIRGQGANDIALRNYTCDLAVAVGDHHCADALGRQLARHVHKLGIRPHCLYRSALVLQDRCNMHDRLLPPPGEDDRSNGRRGAGGPPRARRDLAHRTVADVASWFPGLETLQGDSFTQERG